MKIAIFAATLIVASTVTNAQDFGDRQVLWGGIKTGMTKSEVKSLYPTMKVQLTPGCVASIALTFDKKTVESVKLEHDAASASKSCGTVMIESLKEKYGVPRGERDVTEVGNTSCWGETSCALRDAARIIDPDPNTYWQVVNWFTGEMLVVLRRDLETGAWNITYYQAKLAQPEAATKL